jgi:Transposase DDE domain
MPYLEEIFCFIDDFCKHYEVEMKKISLPEPEAHGNAKRNRQYTMTWSEVMTILISYQTSCFKNFKRFYKYVERNLHEYFPKLVSYNRFLELEKHVGFPLGLLIKLLTGERNGVYFIDSTKLSVCHNKRIFNNKTFKTSASRGKNSMGWFFGFKLHLVINKKGEIMNASLTGGSTDDRKVLEDIMEGFSGTLYGDRGYIGKDLKEKMKQKNIKLVTRTRKNMNPQVFDTTDEFYLGKRSIIETIIGKLKYKFNLEHTRHRSHDNFLINILCCLIAYILTDQKLEIIFTTIESSLTNQTLLTSS